MAIEKEININVNTSNASKKIDALGNSFNNLKDKTKETTGALAESGNAILENGGAMGLLNDATGGVAMTIKDAVEATWLFTKGTTIATATQKIYTLVVGSTTGALKALRIALVSTGLGAIVVALGFLIAKMNEATEDTEAQTRAQEALNDVLKETNELYKESIKLIQDTTKERLLRAKIAGKSEKEIQEIEKQAEEERRNNYINERNRLLTLLKDKNLTAEQQTKINEQLRTNQKEYFDAIEADRIKDLESELSSVEAKRQANKDLLKKQAEDRAKAREEEIRKRKEFEEDVLKGLMEFQQKQRDAESEEFNKKINAEIEKEAVLKSLRDETELEKIKEQEERDLATLERANATQEELFSVQQYYFNKRAELEEAKRKEKDELDEKQKEKERIRDEAVYQTKVDLANNTFALIGELAGEGSKIAKGVAVAQATISGIEGVQNAFTTANKNPITATFPAYPFIQAGLAGAFSAIQIKKILSTDSSNGGGSVGNVSSGGGGVSAPSFNLVQGTGTNQIAEGLATQRRPLQAYVVASNVTSAQALDRNIVNGASI